MKIYENFRIFLNTDPANQRRDRRWRQVSASLFGSDRLHSLRSLEVCGEKRRREVPGAVIVTGAGWGGHFRAVQGFRYVGTVGLAD